MGISMPNSFSNLEWPIICNHSHIHAQTPQPIQETVDIHGSPPKHVVLLAFFHTSD